MDKPKHRKYIDEIPRLEIELADYLMEMDYLSKQREQEQIENERKEKQS